MRDVVVSTVVILLLLIILTFQFLSLGADRSPGEAPEQIRRYAAALEAQQLHKQAAQEYRRYLSLSNDPPEQRANLMYKIGTLYLDNLQDYENALAAFMEVTTLYPNAPIAREAEKRMIPCLEHLNRNFDAQKKLKKLTDLEPEKESQGTGPVVAKVGDETVTLEQLEREIAQLPESVRQQFASPEKKLEFLQNKIFLDLLYDMAVRKEYDKDSQLRQQLRDMEKNLLASRIMQEEVAQKVSVSPGDIDLYFKAHPEEFSIPESNRVAHIQVDSLEKAQEVKKALDEGMDFNHAVETYSQNEETRSREGMLGYVQRGKDLIPGLGSDAAAVETLLGMKPNEISGPVELAGGYHLFRVTEHRPAESYTLEQVKDQVEARVRSMKERELQQSLMQRLLQSDRVKIFKETLQAGQPANQSGS